MRTDQGSGTRDRNQGPRSRGRPLIPHLSMLLLIVLSAAAGCQSYTVQGRVIEGEISYVSIVSADEARLGEQGVGVPNVRVRLETDPERLRREIVGETVTDEEGYFSIPFARPGAGVLMYDIGVTAGDAHHAPAAVGPADADHAHARARRLPRSLQGGSDAPDGPDALIRWGETRSSRRPYTSSC